MLLRPGHRDPGGPPPEEHATRAFAQKLQDAVDLVGVLRVQGRRETSGHGGQARPQIGVVPVPHEQGHRSEALLEQDLRPGGDRRGIRGQHVRACPSLGRRPGGEHLDRRVDEQVQDAFGVGPRDPLGQQRARGHRGGTCREQGLEARSFRHEHHARFGAELTRPLREGRGESGRQFLTAGGDGGGGDDDGVYAAEFAVEGDRVGAGGCQIEQRPSAGQGAGEARRADDGMLHERVAGFAPGDEGEGAVGGSGPGQRARRELGGARGQPGVPRVGLHDHGVARGESRSGVATDDREREREVGGGEDGDRPDAHQQSPELGAGRCRLRGGVVDRDLEISALLDGSGEETKLPGGAGHLAGQSSRVEPGLLGRDRDEVVDVTVELVGDRAQPGCPVRPRRQAPERGGRGGGSGESVEFFGCRGHEGSP